MFHESLKDSGLDLEYVPPEESFNRKTAFLKVHVPEDLLNMNAKVYVCNSLCSRDLLNMNDKVYFP